MHVNSPSHPTHLHTVYLSGWSLLSSAPFFVRSSINQSSLSRQWIEMAGKKSKTVAPTFSKPPYQLTYQQVVDELSTSIENGLSQQQVEANTAKYGENKLEGEGAISPWKILFKQMANAMYIASPEPERKRKKKKKNEKKKTRVLTDSRILRVPRELRFSANPHSATC